MRIHFISIGGAAMHNLALALQAKGHKITGSDDIIFEPSLSRLKNAGILPQKIGWFEENITPDLDAVILGMHARIDNPELIKATQMGIKIFSYPEFIFKESDNKKRIVIGGSHGKTTITSMILHAQKYNNKKVDYLVGAAIKGFERMVELSLDNKYIVIEGDEYLSSPIDLRPKFLHYKPNVALISGIAWDHMNVFKTYESYTKSFEDFIKSIEKGGTLVYNSEDSEVVRIVDKVFRENSDLKIEKIPYSTHPYIIKDGACYLITEFGEIKVPFFGKHNMSNLQGALLLSERAGLTKKEFYDAIGSFQGAEKRLELWAKNNDTIVYKDFAHAPSKVRATVSAVKEMYPQKEVIAALELHTYSSLNTEFLPQYKDTLNQADTAFVFFSKEAMEIKRMPELDKEWVKNIFNHKNIKVFSKIEDLKNEIENLNKKDKIFLFMSSGVWEATAWNEILV